MDTSRNNVLLIVQHLCRGGSEKSVCKLSVELSNKYNIIIATFLSDSIYPTTYDYEGTLLCLNENGNEPVGLKTLKRYNFIRKIKKDYKIDVSISFLKSADIINAFTCNSKHHCISSIRTDFDKLIGSYLNKWIYKYVFLRIHGVHVQNKSNYLKVGTFLDKVKVTIIPNYYKISTIRNKSKQRLAIINREEYKIFSITGTLYPVKGQRHIFKILAQLKLNGYHSMRLLLQGGSDEFNSYKSYAESLDLNMIEIPVDALLDLSQVDIVYLGFNTNPYRLIGSSDAIILSSYYEGSPNALLEGMICGVPVIAADCEIGPRELISDEIRSVKNKRGFLMPVMSEESLEVNALSKEEKEWKAFLIEVLSGRLELNQTTSCATEYVEQFDVARVINEWYNLIENV